MIVRRTSVNLVAACLVISFIGLTGCRTAKFSKPNLSKLAFWKKGTAVAKNDLPPPPARHFDPAPLDGQLANRNFDNDETIELNSQRFQDSLDRKSDGALASIQSAANSLTRPIRKPYSAELPSDNSSVSDFSNAVESKLAGAKNTLSNAQMDFNSAMEDSKNSFKTNLPQASTDGGWKNDFNLPGTNLKTAGSGSKPFYDADGKLVASAQEAKNSITEKLNMLNNKVAESAAKARSVPNQFAAAASQSLTTPSNGFTAPASFKAPDNLQASSGFNAPSGFKTPSDSMASSGFKAPESFNTGGFKAPKSFEAPANLAKQTFGQPTTPAAPAPVSAQENLKLQLVQSQVNEAKAQIEALKAQLAVANQAKQNRQMSQPLGTPNGFNPQAKPAQLANPPAQEPMAPQQRVAQLATPQAPTPQLQTPRFSNANSSSQVASNTYSNSGFGGSNTKFAPTNILRKSLPSSNFPAQPGGVTPPPPTQLDSGYPTTPHGGFTSQNKFGQTSTNTSQNFAPAGVNSQTFTPPAAPAQPATAASFQGNNNTNLQQASTFPIQPDSGAGASRIQSHIDDVDIPDSVLNGNGSYAPGSVNPVKQ